MPGLPSFKEWMSAKDPIRAMLFVTILAIAGLFGYLQVSNNNEKDTLKEQLLKCDTKNYTQDVELKQLRAQYVEVIGLFNNLKGKIETLRDLKKIE